ncbi:MAG: restriction endonuclease [Parvibaculaceae bacterium]
MTDIVVRSRYLKSINIGELHFKESADGFRILRYYIDFRHRLLNLHKELSAPELSMLQHKVDALMAQWDVRSDEAQRRGRLVAGKGTADELTAEAEQKLASLSQILSRTLSVDDRIDWNLLKDFRRYDGKMKFDTAKPDRTPSPQPQFHPPTITFADKILGRRKRKQLDANAAFNRAKEVWRRKEADAEADLHQRIAQWSAEKAAFEADAVVKRQAFQEGQVAENAKVDLLAGRVVIGDPSAVTEHAGLVLENSNYDGLFEKSFDIEYDAPSKTLLLEYQLPAPDDMPRVKAVRFVSATGELKETQISEREQKSNYDLCCYQICLRTLHELFEADEFGNLDRILFNGIANYVDKATGRDTSACILSVLVGRSEFVSIDLRRVDPKACFKSLKGVSASALSALAPIPPVMKLNREDRRFIDPKSTADIIDSATNLASMDWEDFEHLVREVFEREFLSRGGEVKITQASSDGGVDAVAFDPDPITGGKIVIQAKRYTRTVGVAAVRDLYGTMQHEGASRGILVTTTDYGPDAHKFASGKSMTLMTGANLLYLLAKHGIQAKIDVREARKSMNLSGHRH